MKKKKKKYWINIFHLTIIFKKEGKNIIIYLKENILIRIFFFQ